MRLLLLNHNVAWRGGTFLRAFCFGRELARRNHDVTLVTTSPHRRSGFDENVIQGVRIVEAPDLLSGAARTGWDPWNSLRRSLYLRRLPWDLAHAFDCRPAVIAPALALRRHGVPLVIDWADWWGRGGTIEERPAGSRLRPLIRPIETFFEEAFRGLADGTTVISRALGERARRLGVEPATITHLPQGASADVVRPLPRAQCRTHRGVETDGLLVGYLGVLNTGDADLLMKTFVGLRARIPGARLVVVGRIDARLPEIDGLTQTGFLKWPGQSTWNAQDPMVEWLGACDLFVLPLSDTISSRGRWPSKIGDYLAAGRPVVATAVGDVTDLFRRHEIGVATAPDPEALAEALAALWRDPDRRCAMGERARTVAETELSWNVLTDRLEETYRASIERAKSRGPVRKALVPAGAHGGESAGPR